MADERRHGRAIQLARGVLEQDGMQAPVMITFRNLTPSPAIEAAIHEKAAKLDELFDYITSMRVMIEIPHRRHHQGTLFHVRIDLRIPGREIVVSREPAAHHAHEDVYVTIRDAFDEARRQLQGHAETLRVGRKPHEDPLEVPHGGPLEGHVARLNPDDDFGFIETPDGRDIYFHRNSVVGGEFDRLRTGDGVRFSEELGEKGPQATTVHPAGVAHTTKKHRRARA